MTKNKKLTIFLLTANLRNFKSYLKNEYTDKVVRHYINKKDMAGEIEKGIIFTFEENVSPPEWGEYLNSLSEKKDLKITPKRVSKAVLFLKVRSKEKKTFAITFGNGSTLLNSDYVAQDFGLIVSKSLLNINGITSVDSTSIDRKIFNTQKQSSAYLIPEKLLEYGAQSIVRKVHGIYESDNEKFSLGGKQSLTFKGNLELLNDLGNWLIEFASLYSEAKDNLGISDDLKSAETIKQTLDKELSKKILSIVQTANITRLQTSSVKIFPHELFNLDDFNGFFIEGLGYKPNNLADFFIDELNFFQRLKKQLKDQQKNQIDLLKKLKTNKIYRKTNEEEQLKPICSIYDAINYEITYQSKRYILISGKWYEINKDFYHKLQQDIDSIEEVDDANSLNYIKFDNNKHYKIVSSGKRQLSEGKYNEDLAEANNVLMLDRKDFSPDSQTMKKYGLKTNSSIEICDLLYFHSDKIQFIHVKRHSGASGTSHLLTQALVSAHCYLNDNKKVIDHINEKAKQFNDEDHSYHVPALDKEIDKKEIVMAIIDEKASSKKKNSSLLSLLEMVSLRENINHLEYLGFKCYLKFIPTTG